MTRALLAALALEAGVLAAIILLALDMRAHKRVEMLGGVNVWGYRGPVLNQKRPDEIRLAVVGGDLAFGWGVASAETLPMFVRRLVAVELDRPGLPPRLVTAVNLGAQGLTPAEYASWIEHFAYLEPDVICVLPDPGQHRLHEGRFLPDRHSLAFVRFGYSPILPLTAQEKGVITDSWTLRSAGALLARADEVVSPAVAIEPRTFQDALDAATSAAARVARIGVVVVTPPEFKAEDATVAAADPRVRVVHLAALPEMSGERLKLDRFHFSVGGHSRAADAVAPAVLDLIRAVERESP
jgi:hypothetical protein